VQVPADVAFNTPLVMLHPAVPTVVTANEYAPVPEPPEAARVNPVAYTPLTVVSNTAVCVVCVTVKFTGSRVIA
jgi:hypothetical protein